MTPELEIQLRKASEATETNRQRRNELIIEVHQGGASLRQIAAVVGITHAAVRKIILKGTP